MILLGIALGILAGALLSQIRRYPWPLQALLVMAVFSALTFAWIGLGDDATRQPWAVGLMVATLIVVAEQFRRPQQRQTVRR